MAINSDCDIVTEWLWEPLVEVSRVIPPAGGLSISLLFMVNV